MRNPLNIRILALVLLLALLATAPNRAIAQVFTSLYSFTNGSDGAGPQAGLVLSGNTLYGTASGGGTNISGTAFVIGATGTGFSTLHTFSLSSTNPLSAGYTNGNDGTDPESVLVLAGNKLYGTAYAGGTNDCGTVFSVNTDGTGFTTLHTFGVITNYFTNSLTGNNTNTDGSYPGPGLVLSGNTLYGTTEYGGTNGNGTIFSIQTDGTAFTTLYSFSRTLTNNFGVYTNGDGANPASGLIMWGSVLYGTAQYGGANGSGTTFGIITTGSGIFLTGHSFGPLGSNSVTLNTYTNNIYTNSDGAYPSGGLALNPADSRLYGTAQYGGISGRGTIFSTDTKGGSFMNLHNFAQENYCAPIGKLTNGDGVNPQASLVLKGSRLYGTAYAGGTNDCGTVFAMNTDGSGFTALYNFSQLAYNSAIGANTNVDGAYPYGSVVLLSSNMLFGTTAGGGTSGQGTVFGVIYGPGSFLFNPVPLNSQFNGQNLVLSWDNLTLFLQSAPSITGPWTTVSGTSPYSVSATNSMQFFQLMGNP